MILIDKIGIIFAILTDYYTKLIKMGCNKIIIENSYLKIDTIMTG